MFSKKCSYGIRAVIYVASQNKDEFVTIQKVSESLKIPFHFLSKIFQLLTQKNIISSSRGPNGGVTLARSADSISLLEIVGAIEGLGLFDNCILGLDECGDEHPCPLHDQAKLIKKRLRVVFETSTVDEVSKDVDLLNLRLKN